MSFTSYAQNFEDVMLWRALGHVKQGRYLDIGAQDPVIDSVSLGFYERGWRGIHVEPTPTYAEKIRAARPEEIVIEAAVSTASGPIAFHEFPGTGLSTGVDQIASGHHQGGFDERALLVPTVRLSGLLGQAELFHWLKIDVEGMEADVLASWDDHAARPWVVVVEATEPNSQTPSDHLWRHELEKRGYGEVHFDGLSRYFVHSSQDRLKAAFTSPPNIFDAFIIGESHFAARALQERRAALTRQWEGAEARVADGAAELAQLRRQLTDADDLRARLQQQVDAKEQQLLAADAATRDALNKLHAETIALRLELARAEARSETEAAEAERRRDELQQAHGRLLALEQEWGRRLEAQAARNEEGRRFDLRQAEERRLNDVATAEQARKRAEEQQATDHRALQEQSARAIELHQIAHDRGLAYDRVEEARQALAQTLAETQGRLAQEQQHLAAAMQLVTAALGRREGSWQRLGRRLGLASEDKARAMLRSWNRPAVAPQEHHGSLHVSSLPPAVAARDPYAPARTLNELIALQDVAFVRCAYVTTLGRKPDSAGEAHYTASLRRGVSKLQILEDLRGSREGSLHDPGIAGFDRELRRGRRARLALIGGLFPDSTVEPQRRGLAPFRALANQIGLTQASVQALTAEVGSQREVLTHLATEQSRTARQTIVQQGGGSSAVTIEQIIAAFAEPYRG